MKKPVLISGVQPTGKLHIGNYLGVLQKFVELQNSGKYECYFFIADLHSLTEDFNPKEKKQQIINAVAESMIFGVHEKYTTVFVQSAVPAHSELAIILNNIASFSELQRMTQFKDKSKNQLQNINVGLFDYPVLMAADILLYDTEFVPIGDDQLQHLELARTLARKFNNRFGKTFIEPEPILTEVSRLMSLDDPTKKMSKSRPAGCLFLNDSDKLIKEKIKNATTDSGKEIKYDKKNKPGISNLIDIYRGLNASVPIRRFVSNRDIEKKYTNKTYSQFKKDIADTLIKVFTHLKGAKQEQINRNSVEKAINAGNKKADEIANKKIAEVKQKVGLL